MPLPLLAWLGLAAGGAALGGKVIGDVRRSGKSRNPLDDLEDADLIDPNQDNAFLAFLESIGKPGKAVNNALVGNWEGAGRQALDFLGDIPDALIPGMDAIGPLSRRKDKPDFSDVAGGMDPGIAKFLVDIGGGVATDPLSWVPGAAVTKGLSAVGKGASAVAGKLPKSVQRWGKQVGEWTKDALGWRQLTPEQQEVIRAAEADAVNVKRAGQVPVSDIAKTVPLPDERAMVGDIVDNLRHEGGRPVAPLTSELNDLSNVLYHGTNHQGSLTPQKISGGTPGIFLTPDKAYAQEMADRAVRRSGGKPIVRQFESSATKPNPSHPSDMPVSDGTVEDTGVRFDSYISPTGSEVVVFDPSKLREIQPTPTGAKSRVKSHPGVNPENIDRITKAVDETVQFGQRQAKQDLDLGIMDDSGELNPEYLMQVHKGDKPVRDAENLLSIGAPNPIRGRTLRTPDEKVSFYDSPASAGLEYERDAVKRLAGRVDKDSTLARQASLGKSLLGDEFTSLKDPATRTAIEGAIGSFEQSAPDYYRALKDVYNGLEPRGPVLDVLAKFNRIWKPMVVAGVVWPKFSALVRNVVTGGGWQVASTQGLKAAGRHLKDSPMILLGAIDDGIVKAFGLSKRLTGGKLTKDIDLIEQAFQGSGGVAENATEMLRNVAGREDLAAAIENNVLQGMVSSEEMLRSIGREGWQKVAMNLIDAPGEMYQGIETRMRLANFLHQYHGQGGKSVQDIAQEVDGSFLNYGIAAQGGRNYRTFRDNVPFFAFMSQSIPQQAKFLAKTPPVAVGLSQLYDDDPGHPVYSYLEGKANIPIGTNDAGERQYISGLGMPFETLGMVPNFSNDIGDAGRDFKRNIIGSSHPITKTAASAVMGSDPYWESPFGAYDKVPLFGEQGDAGQAYNLLNSLGVTAPFDVPARQLDKLLKPDRSIGIKALDLLTGANVVDVDEDRALQQQLQALLESNPDVGQHRSFFNQNDDPDIQELLSRYQGVRKKTKAKRESQAKQ